MKGFSVKGGNAIHFLKAVPMNPTRHSPLSFRRFFRPAPLAAAMAVAWSLQAHAAPQAIDLPAQPLSESIKALARQSAMTIAADDALLAGKQAPAVRGNLEPAEALRRLLQGSGVEAEASQGTWVLRRESEGGAPAEPPTLPAVRVTARHEQPTAATPVTGYVARRTTSGTKTDAAIRDIPQAIVVVTSDQLRDRGVAKVIEAADTVAGVVRESSYGGNPASATFIIRGFEALTLRDGLRLNPQGFGDALDVGTIERIEVLKGPAAVLYGASEPGGTVNLVSKRPYTGFGGEAQAWTDTFGTTRLGIDLNTPLTSDDRLLFRINAAREKGDTYREFVKRDNTLIAPTLQWQVLPGTRVTAQYERVRSKGLFDRGLGQTYAYPGTGIDYRSLPTDRFIGEPSIGPSRTTTSQSILTLEQDIAPDWRVRLAHSDNRFDFDNQPEISLDTFDPGTGLFSRYFIDYETQGERTRTTVLDLQGKFKLLSTEHSVLAGVEEMRNKAYYVAVQGVPAPAPIDVRNPVYSGYAGYSTPFYYSGLQGSQARAVYLQDIVTLAPQWKLLLAARHDRAERYSGAFPGQPDDTGVVNRSKFSRTSPRAGVVFQPTVQDSLYLSYSTSFAPSTFINLRDPSSFKPEVGKQMELGWKRDWADGRLTSTASLFDIRKRNVALSDPTNMAGEFFEIQVGEVSSRGAEFDLTGSPWSGLQVTAGLGYADVKIRESGERMPRVPRITANLWISQKLAQQWTIGAGLFHASEALVSTPDDGQRQPAFTRLDASLSWSATPWRIQLSGKNLNNVKYYTTGTTFMPQPPRHAVLSASYRF